jgi:hypothetical protein
MGWGTILAIVAIALMYPVGVLINLTTPLVQNWIAARSKVSLIKRIALLESKLAKLEENPPITEVEDHLLWGIKNLKITVFGAANGITFVFYLGMRTVGDTSTTKFQTFSIFIMCVLTFNLVMQMGLRRGRDFRFERSPRTRKNLRTAIDDLKKILASWPS